MLAKRDSYLALPVAALVWLGRLGPRAVTGSVFIGIAVPLLGQYLRPFVTHTIFLMLSISLMRPVRILELLLGAFAVFFSLFGLTVLSFRRIGHERAVALGLMVSQRNMGLMLAATDGLLPGSTWLYFALLQTPIYLSPPLLKPIADRMRRLRSSGPEC